ncbi:MAG: FdhF/YdeP family oxidoreductase [Candidatus Obscuribacterales bacterium]|nr:FdhF/YdeP family oxidoreductase [Candidatus Obscuribacterales bacterium]
MGGAKKPRPGGGFPAVVYTFRKALEAGPWRLWKRMRSRNACKTCALGMGGQKGGMVNEAGHFPEVCKKSLQAQVADMQDAIDPQFFQNNNLSELLKLTPKQAEDLGRLAYPLFYDNESEKFKPVSWEFALSTASKALKATKPQRAAFYSSGRSSNEAAFLLQSFARIYGSNNVMNCSYYCHQASGVALKMTLGVGTATVELDDLDRCDLVVLLGANPASNHPRLMTKLANLRGRGGKIIVVNPLKESGLERFHVPSQIKSFFCGSQIASLYVQPLAGGDAAFLVGVLKSLIDAEQIKHDFLREHCDNYEPVLEYASTLAWEEIERASGVERQLMVEVAQQIAQAQGCIFAWAMGLTHHQSGVTNILALCNLALASGQIAKPGAGLLPIRGHSNVQGIGSTGFSPSLQEGIKKSLQSIYGVPFADDVGYDTYGLMKAALSGNMDLLIALGGNLWGSNPDSKWAAAAMQNIGLTVYLSTKLNPGHFHGRGKNTLILPVLARDEEPQATTQESMFNFVRLSDGGQPNLSGQMRAESEVICEIADQVLGKTPLDWHKLKDLDQVRKLIARSVPGWEEIADIGQSKKEFTIAGRIFHEPKFPTVNGRATLHPTPLPEFDPEQLRLVTLRSEGQFNTVVYEEYDLYRGVPHRHCILLSKEDAFKYKLKDGQKITVRGEAGRMSNIEVLIAQIRPGVAAMYYPESNVLIRGNVDPRSGTPSFKSAPIWLETN